MNMQSIQHVGRDISDAALIAEQGQYLSTQAIKAARRAFKGRQLFGNAVTYVPHGTQTYAYDVRTGTSAARIDPKYPGPESLDGVSHARSTANINCLHKEFHVDHTDWVASQTTGENLSSANSDELAYQVALLEDTMLLKGTTIEGTVVNGLYNSAGNSEATNLGWGTAANIVTSVNNSITLLEADHIYGPFNAVLNSAQAGAASVPFGSAGATYADWILKRINGYDSNSQIGRIYVTEAMTAGTGMLVKANPIKSEMEYVIADELQVELEEEGKREGRGLFGRVFINSVPIFHNTDVICTMTDIGGS
jgi:uncharacterized linocin/CFP29 family protein